MQQLPSISRSRVLVVLMCILGAVFIMRLFYLQILQHAHYEAEATKEHIGKFAIPAKRGQIFAHDGEGKYAPLVMNEPAYTVYADPRYIKDTDKVETVLRRVAGGNVVDGFEQSLANKERQYVVLARQINKQQADLIKKEKLVGVGLQEYEKRVYPEGQLASQVLGFVNGEGKGQYGVEQALNEELSGKAGQLKAITDVYGIPISVGEESVQVSAQNGKNLVLAIDRNIQTQAEQLLKSGLDRAKATKGSILIMNPNNGHIMAMANLPTFNPREYHKVTDYKAFQNAIIGDPYEPGSVIKPFTMSAGLNEGVVKPDTTYDNTGSTQVADHTIKNASHDLMGKVNMTQVLRYSYNTGAVFVLRQLGGGDMNSQAKEKLYQYFTDRYFLGKKTGVSLAGEAAGDVIPPDDPQGGDVRYANMTFGQGMSLTMLQTVAAFSAMVNGGTYYTPQIVSGTLDEEGTFAARSAEIRKTNVISSDASSAIRTMMHEARSTSPLGRQDKGGYTVGGKTGTAQVYDAKTGKYSETDTIGSYLGFGGQTKPEYVIMIRVDDSKTGDFAGSFAAAPIFADLSNWLLDYLKIQPKG